MKLPTIMEPVRATDVPGAVCYRTTPETYLGYERGSIGNKEGYSHDEVVSYPEPNDVEKDHFYLVGKWDIESQFVRYAGDANDGKLVINYAAAEANLVIRPRHVILPMRGVIHSKCTCTRMEHGSRRRIGQKICNRIRMAKLT